MTPLLKAFHYLPKIGQYSFSLSVIVNEVKKIIPNERLFAFHYALDTLKDYFVFFLD